MYHRKLTISNIESCSNTFAVTSILTYLQCVKTKEFVQKMVKVRPSSIDLLPASIRMF